MNATKLGVPTALFALAMLGTVCPAQELELKQRPLSNEDIVTLTNAGLPPAVIVSKIRGSQTDFDTSVDELVDLAKAGIHPDVLAAMTGAGENPSSPVPESAGEPDFGEIFKGTRCDAPGIYFIEGDTLRALAPTKISQQLSSGGFKSRLSGGISTVKARAAVRGASSETRVENARPSFLFCFAEAIDPRDLPLVPLRVHADRKLRSFVAGKSGSLIGSTSGTPGELQTTVRTVQPGVYEVEPAESLKPGEYGFFTGSGLGISVGLFDSGDSGRLAGSSVGGSAAGLLFTFGVS